MKIARMVILFTFILMILIGCDGTSSKKNKMQGAINSNFQVENEVIKDLGLSLASTGQAARVYFGGSCDKDSFGHLLLPILSIQAPTKGGGFESVKEMFSDDSDVAVSLDSTGLVRIRIGKLSMPVLEAALPLIELNEEAQYNPNGPDGAISTILRTTEAQAAMSRLKIRQAPTSFVGLSVPAQEKQPHLPPSIKNTTIQKALDSVAITFRGVVLYGECTSSNGENLLDVYYAHFPENKRLADQRGQTR